MDTANATSSPESADGLTHCNSLAGRQTDLFGQEAAHANHSARLETRKASKTKETYGRLGFGSSESAALTRYLGNRLQELLTSDGSIERVSTWSEKITPAGRLYWEHTAAAVTRNDYGFGFVPTPKACDTRDRGTINKTPAIKRRQDMGKELNLSTLFDGAPCPFCVGGIQGYPAEFVRLLCEE